MTQALGERLERGKIAGCELADVRMRRQWDPRKCVKTSEEGPHVRLFLRSQAIKDLRSSHRREEEVEQSIDVSGIADVPHLLPRAQVLRIEGPFQRGLCRMQAGPKCLLRRFHAMAHVRFRLVGRGARRRNPFSRLGFP